MATRRLAVFSNVKAISSANGRVILAGRLISGMEAHGKYWDGQLVCVCEEAPASDLAYNVDRALGADNVEVNPAELPYELVVADFTGEEARRTLAGVTVAIAGIGHRATHLSHWGNELGVPVVYGTEYSIRTRLQIQRAEVRNPLRLARRVVWELALERKQRAAIRVAAGVHCCGTPTYDDYSAINPNAMLFFDGRMNEDMLVNESVQAERHARLRRCEPLRLAWSGRLNRMKGADQLPRFAAELKKLGIRFSLEIFGGGVLEDALRKEVHDRGLAGCVEVKGFVDFYKVLTPHMQHEVDIWVCPHPQGDPSGAYIETLGSGLPIIGYANEALAGMLRRVDAGRTVAIGNARALAVEVANADRDRERLIRWSIAARKYAGDHTFYKSFARRMKHIDDLLAQRGARIQ